MTSRSTAILVAVAVVAGAAVAGVGFATRGSGTPARVLRVDEQAGRVGQVVLGETGSSVVSALGPSSTGGDTLRYPHLLVGLRAGHVTSIETDDTAARTDRAVRIGDPLSAARASYARTATCNPNAPDKSALHPFCDIRVGSGRMLVTGDPIRSITLSRTR